jgi:YD repeat-containing protein
MISNKLGNTTGVTWDEYGNPVPITNNEQSIIDYNAMEEEWEMDNYNEMNNE